MKNVTFENDFTQNKAARRTRAINKDIRHV